MQKPHLKIAKTTFKKCKKHIKEWQKPHLKNDKTTLRNGKKHI